MKKRNMEENFETQEIQLEQPQEAIVEEQPAPTQETRTVKVLMADGKIESLETNETVDELLRHAWCAEILND